MSQRVSRKKHILSNVNKKKKIELGQKVFPKKIVWAINNTLRKENYLSFLIQNKLILWKRNHGLNTFP